MKCLLFVPLVATLLACGSTGQPVNYYTLSTFVDLESPDSVARPVVGVAPFRVEPPYDESRLVYRIGDESPRVDFYAYHQWARPVGRDVAQAVADRLTARRPDHRFELLSRGRPYVATVHGRLLRLEEVDHASGVEARVRLELELRTSSGEVLGVGRGAGQARSASATVEEVVKMMRRSLDAAVDQASQGLLTVLGADGEAER